MCYKYIPFLQKFSDLEVRKFLKNIYNISSALLLLLKIANLPLLSKYISWFHFGKN
jgi:hypothetical protein